MNLVIEDLRALWKEACSVGTQQASTNAGGSSHIGAGVL